MVPAWLLLQQSQRSGCRPVKVARPVVQQQPRVCHHISKKFVETNRWQCQNKKCAVLFDSQNKVVSLGRLPDTRWGVQIEEHLDLGFLREEFNRQQTRVRTCGFTEIRPEPKIVTAVRMASRRLRAGDAPRGNLQLAEYQFWVGSQQEMSLFARCRGCREAIVGEYDQRKAHIELKHCTTALVVASKKMLGRKKCMYCRVDTVNRRWGVPMCSDNCARGWMFNDSAVYPEFQHEVEEEMKRQRAYEIQADSYRMQREAAVEGP